MSSSPAARVGDDGEPAIRPRPRVHFTAQRGWINDPYGVTWSGGRYHVFYQYVPQQTTWSPRCWWGHADSTDLVHWTEREPALAPQAYETGCWSGSAALDADGARLFYTRITDDQARGAVAVARGDSSLGRWGRTEGDVVIAHAPAELDVTAFRDPFVFRHGDRWQLVVGAGLPGSRGAVLQYHSDDLQAWTYDGVLCVGEEALWSGSVWECPQLVPVGEEHLLLVSVWDRGATHYVLSALGRYDGLTFAPRVWRRLTHGSSAYATTAFLDAAGRPSVLSWLREEPPDQPDLPDRAGALSVPAVVRGGPDGAVLSPHPELLAGATPLSVPESDTDTRLVGDDGPVHLRIAAEPGVRLEIDAGGRSLATLRVEGSQLLVERSVLPADTMPVGSEIEVVVDADIVEVFGPGGYGAFRIRNVTGPTGITIAGPHPAVEYALLR